MVPLPFWLTNAQFVIGAFSAFAFFSAAWLNIDSWAVRRELKTALRTLSFLLLAVWSALHGINLTTAHNDIIIPSILLAGLATLLISYLSDRLPLQPKELAKLQAKQATTSSKQSRAKRKREAKRKTKLAKRQARRAAKAKAKLKKAQEGKSGKPAKPSAPKSKPVRSGWLDHWRQRQAYQKRHQPKPQRRGPTVRLIVPLPTLLVAAAVLATLVLIIRLFIHVTRGATKELKLLAWALLFYTLAWIIGGLGTLPWIHEGPLILLFTPFGLAWYVEHSLLLIGLILLIKWAWHYIALRPLPQFYLSIVAIGLSAFVLSTVLFTSLLFNQGEAQALTSVEANVKTFALALSELTDRTTFTTAAIAARENLVTAAQTNNPDNVAAALGDPIADYNVAAAYVLNAGGELLTTLGTESSVGQSFAADLVAQQVLKGEVTGSVLLQPSVQAPTVIIRSGSPLVRDRRVVGAVLVDTPLDNAFVDRVGAVTGLDITIYAQEHRAATTLRDNDGRSLVPATIEDPVLAEQTLNQGNVFRGTSTIGSRPYVVAALPLTTTAGTRVGVLVAGLPVQALLDGLAQSARTSFTASFILLLLALGPFYFVARFLARSVKDD